jgi:hypothetical protein
MRKLSLGEREHRECEHRHNMRQLSEEDRCTIERLASKWAHENDSEPLPAGVIPLRPRAA